MKTKICTKCKKEQELFNFNNNSNKLDGKQPYCKFCQSIYNKKRWKENKDHVYKLNKKWKDNNPEYYINYNKKYEQNNKIKILEYHKKYNRIKYKKDPIFRLKDQISTFINSSLNKINCKKNIRSYKILGCSFEEFKLYLESKFEPWMTWENQGKYNGDLNYGWDIDHIIPISSATTEEEILKLNHYSNLQPLCSKVNRDIKRNII